ncbi:MAG TPA: hypothetical protein PLU37_12085 [Chitinophagaceae bacterium]|nr:hypothetical protein [Chitinophagaceae bacterium]MCB9054315.1 hypothetical protein [Chitinophagales bacterium]HPG12264.1 hypothetical protein [Chitinophagaceae bacterium]HRX94851.1 hypothetical protein [Chitinophagaceae bacterium]
MKAKTFTPMGSLHPILFFAGVYVVALLASVFIFSSLFYSCNASATKSSTEKTISPDIKKTSESEIAYR